MRGCVAYQIKYKTEMNFFRFFECCLVWFGFFGDLSRGSFSLSCVSCVSCVALLSLLSNFSSVSVIRNMESII